MRENPNDLRVVLALANLSRLSKDYNWLYPLPEMLLNFRTHSKHILF